MEARWQLHQELKNVDHVYPMVLMDIMHLMPEQRAVIALWLPHVSPSKESGESR